MESTGRNIFIKTAVLFLIFIPFMSVLSECRNTKAPANNIPAYTGKKDSVKRISIIFGGDIMQHMPQITAAYRDTGYSYESTFQYLKPVFNTADLVIANLEGTLSEAGPYSGYPRFKAPAALAKAIRECGIDAVMLANNHICDKGKKGIKSTVTAVTAAGLRYTGACTDSVSYKNTNPLYFNVNGFRLAILNYSYGTNGLPVPDGFKVNILDTTVMATDFQKINKDSTDYIVVFLHWGNEYSRQPDKNQIKTARWCRKQGASIIVGSHPHVIQPVETERDSSGNLRSLTAYSLGNLVSNQRRRYCNGGMLLKIEITAKNDSVKEMNASYMPVWVYKHYKGRYREFAILPPETADTVIISNPAAREKYEEFITDTRSLLSSENGIPEFR